jgi:hypothetical protein
MYMKDTHDFIGIRGTRKAINMSSTNPTEIGDAEFCHQPAEQLSIIIIWWRQIICVQYQGTVLQHRWNWLITRRRFADIVAHKFINWTIKESKYNITIYSLFNIQLIKYNYHKHQPWLPLYQFVEANVSTLLTAVEALVMHPYLLLLLAFLWNRVWRRRRSQYQKTWYSRDLEHDTLLWRRLLCLARGITTCQS